MNEVIQEGAKHISNGAIAAALLIFLGVYAAIISEKLHRTAIAIFGGALMIIVGIIFGFYDQHTAVESIDFNTIGLLVGMMIIVAITKETGLFQYVAIQAVKFAKGQPWRIMVLFAVITAVFSALLNNVTNVLLMVPMTLVICDNLKINPIPFLFIEILMSNIGGTATLIGDPPNILIGSAANLSFLDFVIILGPVIVIIFLAVLLFFKWKYGREIQIKIENVDKILKFNAKESIVDTTLLKKTLFVLGLVILGFLFQSTLNMESATIAIFGAGLLLILDQKNIEKALREVEWVSIFFFIGLFVVIGALEQVGVINWAADKLLKLTGGSLAVTSILILWGSAFFSAFVDNIPFVATMIPMVKEMHTIFANLDPIWWSLALGACLGGNGTLVGASSNLVVAGLAGKSGYHITFKDFLTVGMTVMIISVAISNIYLYFLYLS
jgi:Na+/H+ antiporter NhaD/arsenite permease-like protein